MPRRPDLKVISHLPQFIASPTPETTEHLLTGSFPGALLRREVSSGAELRLIGAGGFLSPWPARVEVSTGQPSGGTEVQILLWYPGQRRRCFLWALGAGALLATAAALAWGWLLTWSVPACLITAVAVDQMCWQGWKSRTRRGLDKLLRARLTASASDPAAPSEPRS